MTRAADPVLLAVARAALEATGAIRSRIVAEEEGELRLVAAAGEGGNRIGEVVADDSTAAYVLASGQATSLAPDAGGESQGVASATVCAPCTSEGAVLGALEMAGAEGGEPFGVDQMRVGTLFAEVAGAVLARGGATAAVPGHAELATELGNLAKSDPDRYAALAPLISALLAHG